MKIVIRTVSIVLLFSAFAAVSALKAQSADCPPDKVCISPDAARKALENADLVEAQKKEIDVLRQAVMDQKLVTADVKIELAKAFGEKTQLEIANLRLDGNLTVCMKKRAVKVGLFNF